MIIVGGGGYTLRNGPRCWTYETSLALGIELENDIPEFEFHSYYSPEYKIHMPASNMENNNSKEEIEKIVKKIQDNLKNVTPANVDHSAYRN